MGIRSAFKVVKDAFVGGWHEGKGHRIAQNDLPAKLWNNTLGRTTNAATGAVKGTAGIIGTGFGLIGKATEKGAKVLGFGMGRTGLTMAAGVALAGAAAVGLGAYMMMTPGRRGKTFSEDDVPLAQIPPLLTPQDLVLQPMASQDFGPAEGRGVNEWQMKMRPGQQPAMQPSIDPSLAAKATQLS